MGRRTPRRVRSAGRGPRHGGPPLSSARPRAGLADLVTITGGVSGFLALLVAGRLWLDGSAEGPGLHRDTLVLCLLLYAISMTCDVLDGPVARRRGSSGLGATLDTMCDTISFGLLPGMLLVACWDHRGTWTDVTVVAAGIYVGATIFRLARQSALEAAEQAAAGTLAGQDPLTPSRGEFSGMPSPVGGNCILALVVLTPPAGVAVAVVAVVAYLLVADFPYPNNASAGGIFVAGLLLLSFAAIAGLVPLSVPAAVALIGLLPIALLSAMRTALAR